MRKKHSPERRQQLQKISRSLKCFYATGPWSHAKQTQVSVITMLSLLFFVMAVALLKRSFGFDLLNLTRASLF